MGDGLTTADPLTGQKPTLVENFELGVAGLADLAVKGATFGYEQTHFAADLYSKQVVEDTGSATLGADAQAGADQAESAGALSQAADMTATQVWKAAKDVGSGLANAALYAGIAVGGLALILGGLWVAFEVKAAKRVVGA